MRVWNKKKSKSDMQFDLNFGSSDLTLKRKTKHIYGNVKTTILFFFSESIITLNINGLNAPTERQRLVEQIRKHGPEIHCLFIRD